MLWFQEKRRCLPLYAMFLAIVGFTSYPVLADDKYPLLPRVEGHVKYGDDRALGMGEFWIPLAQDERSVVYSDIRFMQDNDDNAEGNLGVGYRILKDGAVYGVHGWIDRRKTALGSTFHQATFGTEHLGNTVDARVNAYVPLNDSQTRATANKGRPAPYLSDSGIYYDTNGTVLEEPQGGFDAELGVRLPVFEDSADAIRVYGGGYRFIGRETPDVTGWRVRLAVDISPAVSLGGRFQNDHERGNQSFLEATFRFPFKAKKQFRSVGIRARLDESPERDVDIVSGRKIMDTGLKKPVFNSDTSQLQRVLYVDNTASAGGDGSREHPFNQLKLAEAALRPNDILYIKAGNGTASGQSLGLVIDKPNISVIGSGIDFVFDGTKFSTRNTNNFSGVVLAQKTSAPVITNITPSSGTDVGNGVYVTGDNAYVGGIDVKDSTNSNVRVRADNKTVHATIDSVSSYNGSSVGIWGGAANGGTLYIDIADSHVDNAGSHGIQVRADGAGSKTYATVSGNTATRSTTDGINARAQDNAYVHAIMDENISEYNNAAGLTFITENSGAVLDGAITNNAARFNGQGLNTNTAGIYVRDVNNNNVTARIENNIVKQNLTNGVLIDTDSTGIFTVDMGGGTLGSQGHNSIYGNGTGGATHRDLKLDLNNQTMFAQGNWWGQAGGPVMTPGSERIVNQGACPASCGAADTSNPLNGDPAL